LANLTNLAEPIDKDHTFEGPWIINGYSQALERAKQENKPLILDFWAEWCVACNELDHKVWNTPEVEPELARFVAVKFDFTKNDQWSKDMQAKFRIKGMPTVIFMTPNEEELGRFTGFKPKEEVLKLMQEVKYP
jgi:thioredoxin:protein disulfide reductase